MENNMPTKEQLENDLKNNTKQKVCQLYKINDRTLKKWIEYYQLVQYIKQKVSIPSKEELQEYLKNHTLTEARQNYKVKKAQWISGLKN